MIANITVLREVLQLLLSDQNPIYEILCATRRRIQPDKTRNGTKNTMLSA